jgi:hypothetical protein
MRLNGWQRIGLVASVIWAIGAPIYLDNAADRNADETFYLVYDSCRDVPSNDPNQCFQRASRAHDNVPRYTFNSANGALTALVPIGLGWLVAYALVYLVRWIGAGFAKQ